MSTILQTYVTSLLPHLNGWCTPHKASALMELIYQTRPATVVEIGVFGGASLIPQALALQENGTGIIHGIDPWAVDSALEGEQDQANIDWWKKVNLDAIMEDFHKALIDAKVLRRVTIHPVTSTAALSHFGPGSIQILHIDGCHSELSSVRDVRNWLPKVADGGYIWFDDTDWNSTAKAVALLESKCQRIWSIGNCALFVKGKERVTFKPPVLEQATMTAAPLPPESLEQPEQPAPEHILTPQSP